MLIALSNSSQKQNKRVTQRREMFADYFDSNFGKVRRKHSTLKYLIDLVQGFKMQMINWFSATRARKIFERTNLWLCANWRYRFRHLLAQESLSSWGGECFLRQLSNIIRLEKFTIVQECVKLITDLFQVFQLG